ncbi:unnamed protein product [Ceratitis capitata]|uniref:(Mediterranean fruit fly) hypothetical protein n=1 Tax=Ceratitis capitata TaxID=7213 RepID=A0A811V9W5_CERCA|nr:unnamed protein product [Ceratitis capitata]
MKGGTLYCQGCHGDLVKNIAMPSNVPDITGAIKALSKLLIGAKPIVSWSLTAQRNTSKQLKCSRLCPGL